MISFAIRASAGKTLPVTCTEVLVRLRRTTPTVYSADNGTPNDVRWRIDPDVTIALGLTGLLPHDQSLSVPTELLTSRHPRDYEMDAYERLCGDALRGDNTLFACKDDVEEA